MNEIYLTNSSTLLSSFIKAWFIFKSFENRIKTGCNVILLIASIHSTIIVPI